MEWLRFSPGGVLCGTAKFRTPTTVTIIFKLVTKPNMVEFVTLGPSMARMALSSVARPRVVGQKVKTTTTASRSEKPQETIGEPEGLDCCQSRPTILTTTPLESAGREECNEFQARDGYQQDNVHKELMHDIKHLQERLDITSGTDVFPNPE